MPSTGAALHYNLPYWNASRRLDVLVSSVGKACSMYQFRLSNGSAGQEIHVSIILAMAGMAAAVLRFLLLAYMFVRSRLGHFEDRIKASGR
jgi:hypothetical protein